MFKPFLTATVAAALTAAPAFAATSYSGQGEGSGTAKTGMTQIGEGHMVLDIANEYENVSAEDAATPMIGSTGPCHGAVHVEQGAVSGDGFCAFTDPEGDTWVVRWLAESMDENGAIAGSWELVSGTGKYDGANGGGSYSSLTDQEAGTFVNSITMDVSLP